jgi:hypothetical protein
MKGGGGFVFSGRWKIFFSGFAFGRKCSIYSDDGVPYVCVMNVMFRLEI